MRTLPLRLPACQNTLPAISLSRNKRTRTGHQRQKKTPADNLYKKHSITVKAAEPEKFPGMAALFVSFSFVSSALFPPAAPKRQGFSPQSHPAKNIFPSLNQCETSGFSIRPPVFLPEQWPASAWEYGSFYYFQIQQLPYHPSYQ